MSIKKIVFLSTVLFLNIFVGQVVAAEKAPTFLITRNSLSPATINLPALSQITVYFNVKNESPQRFPAIDVIASSLPPGVSVTTNGNTSCVVKTQPLAAGATCVLGLSVVGIKQGDSFVIAPQVCDSTGTYCSVPDLNNRITVNVTAGGGGGSVVISTPTRAALLVAEAPLTTAGQTQITVSNLSTDPATNVTLNTSILPADYQSAITVDNSDCVTIPGSGSCTIIIETAAGSTAAAASAATIISGSNSNFTEITLWMGGLTVEKNEQQAFQFPSLIYNQTAGYQGAGGNIIFDNLTFSTDVSTFVEWCTTGVCTDPCTASGAVGNNCTVWTEALLPTNQDFTSQTFDSDMTLSETGVAYEYLSPSEYTLGLYAGTFENGVQFWNGTTWDTLIAGGGNLFTNVMLWNNNLYVGGPFTNLQSVSGATGIALYNNVEILPLSTGLGITGGSAGLKGAIAIVPSGSDLLVGGAFDSAGGTPVNNIASWDGTTWSALGGGIGVGNDATVFSIAVVGGTDIYATGVFSQVNDAADDANNIAFFDGATWAPLVDTVFPISGGGISGPGRSVFECASGFICVGGSFDKVATGSAPSGFDANNAGAWNIGSQIWTSLGANGGGVGVGGAPGILSTNLLLFNTNLYSTGAFTTVNDNTTPANNIAFFNVGTNLWSATDVNGLNGASNYEVVWNGKLYVAGCFTTAGGSPAAGAAYWTGASWVSIATGFDSTACVGPLTAAVGGMTAASTLVFQ